MGKKKASGDVEVVDLEIHGGVGDEFGLVVSVSSVNRV